MRQPPSTTPFPCTTRFRSELGRHLARRGDAVAPPPQLVGDRPLVARIQVAVEQAHGHGGDGLGHVREAGEVEGLDLRSEEHTSELPSRQYLVCRLLLEKKN